MARAKAGDLLAGKYRVDRVIGEGGMGVVVAATHVQLEERYALKFMLPSAVKNPDASARFLQEAKAAAKLKSEHVARVHDVGTLESGAPYIVMEYLEGEDLARILLTRGPLSLTEAADCVLQACDAVAEAHARGIIHRDLKPANLFVARGADGQPIVKVLDFGISKSNPLNEGGVSRTRSSVLLGSPLYMSPEQMKSARDVTPASDLWSLGVILYEAVGGRVPYDAGTVGALMAKILTEVPPTLQSVRADVPDAFAAVVSRCLEREPAQRFGNVGELALALAPFASPRLQPLAQRVVSVLSAGPPPPARLSGLEATLADPSGSLPDVATGAGSRPGADGRRVETAGGWGRTASGGAVRRWAVVAIGAAAACVVASLLFVAFVVTRGAAPRGASSPSVAAAPPAVDSAPQVLVAAPPATSAAPSAPAPEVPSPSTHPASWSDPPPPPAPAPPASTGHATKAAAHAKTPAPAASDAFGDSRK